MISPGWLTGNGQGCRWKLFGSFITTSSSRRRHRYIPSIIDRNFHEFDHNSNQMITTKYGRRVMTNHTSKSKTIIRPQSTTNHGRSPIQIYNLLSHGCMEYTKTWAWQQILLSRRLDIRRQQQQQQQQQEDQEQLLLRLQEDPDCVLLVEHKPVYTLGRGADETHIAFLRQQHTRDGTNQHPIEKDHPYRLGLSRKARGESSARLALDRPLDSSTLWNHSLEELVELLSQRAAACRPVPAPNGVPIYRVERGGEVTFHGPSQLVVYPLLDLRRPPFQQDLHWYLRQIEQVIIETLRYYGIHGNRHHENTGVWVGNEKVAAIGVSSSRWITTHGFALNVQPNLEYFDTSVILPCGIPDKGVTSMAQLLLERGETADHIPTMDQVAEVVLEAMQTVFDVPLEPCTTAPTTKAIYSS